MATKQQLKSQLDSRREENQLLEDVLQQRLLNSPHTPWQTRVQKARGEAREAQQELEAVRNENMRLVSDFKQLQRATRFAKQQRD